ncbi:MAG: cytochrome c [Yoonia sp.]|nr:cytochrome c [Yoonia sp.]
MKLVSLLCCLLLPFRVHAQEREFTLSAPVEFAQTGFLKHILPRFSLKHGVRITVLDADADVVIGANGIPVFVGLGTVWHVSHKDDVGPVLFTQWLLSDIGKRTIDGFQPDGDVLFSSQVVVEEEASAPVFEGDPVKGEALSLSRCGRCHVINETNRMNGIGQTPSFALMRTFEDWWNRFGTFYVLNPHPSFSQVAGLTQPFPANLPPAIVPLEITQDDLDAILAYVATIAPADLGAPLQSQ